MRVTKSQEDNLFQYLKLNYNVKINEIQGIEPNGNDYNEIQYNYENGDKLNVYILEVFKTKAKSYKIYINGELQENVLSDEDIVSSINNF